MKKSLVTLLLTAFCFAAFAMEVPQQDTGKVKQHHSGKMMKKSGSKKMKSWKKTGTTSRDTMNNKAGRMGSAAKTQ